MKLYDRYMQVNTLALIQLGTDLAPLHPLYRVPPLHSKPLRLKQGMMYKIETNEFGSVWVLEIT